MNLDEEIGEEAVTVEQTEFMEQERNDSFFAIHEIKTTRWPIHLFHSD